MKKFLKLGLGVTFAFIMMLSLTGCGNTEDKPSDNGGNSQKQTEKQNDNKTGNDWKDINENNCVSIVKDKTNIDLSKMGTFTVTYAYGTSSKAADITANYGSGVTKENAYEKFIKELLRAGNNSLWTTDVNNTTYKIEKVKEYTTYESFMEWKMNGGSALESKVSDSLYIDNYRIGYTFTDTEFNIHIAYNVVK